MMTEELDFEAEIPVLTNVRSLNEVEHSAPNAVQKQLVKEDVSDIGMVKRYIGQTKDHLGGVNCDTGGIESDTREVELKSDTEEAKSITGEVDSVEEKSDTGEVESDTGEISSETGEIPDDELGDLEEGEIDEDTSVQNKTSEVVCRFFQRGTCMYGSECRNPHVSNMVYNMFDPVLSNRSNFKPFEMQNFHGPPVFHPMPMMPDFESPWERGIKNAKIVMQRARKLSDDLDIENDWQRCLEEAQANIQKAEFKRKTFDVEKPYFDSKYSKQEKFRERSPMKREHESNIKESSKQNYSKICYSKYENESNYEKRTKPLGGKPIVDQWVDPWQRSKLPRKRIRSMSFSVSPSSSVRHSRNRSVSSSSSSSSCFKHIYGSSHKVKSPRKRSRSTSHSASPHSKKGRISKSHAYSQKRSFSRSVSKTFSKSPRKRLYSGSSSSEYSGKSVRKNPNNKKENVKIVSTSNNSKRYISSERPKNGPLPSVTKSSFNKTCRRSSSPSNSDSSSSSNLSASSLSCTSVSSISDINDLPITISETKEEKTYSRRDQPLQEKRPKEALKLSQKNLENKYLNSSPFRRLSKELDGYSKQKKPSPDRSKLQMPSGITSKSKLYSDKMISSLSATSVKIINQASKPIMVKKETNQKPSEAAMELLMYHSFGQTDDKANPLSQVIKPSQAKNISLPLEATKSKDKTYLKVPSAKSTDVAPSKITPCTRSKSQPMKLNTCATTNVKKEAVSKRNFLLQQLQAIEDAIARKKQPAQ